MQSFVGYPEKRQGNLQNIPIETVSPSSRSPNANGPLYRAAEATILNVPLAALDGHPPAVP